MDYGRIALELFRAQKIPFWLMTNADALIGNTARDNSRWCLAKTGEIYLVYLPAGGTADLDLTAAPVSPRFSGSTREAADRRSVAPGQVSRVGPKHHSVSRRAIRRRIGW